MPFPYPELPCWPNWKRFAAAVPMPRSCGSARRWSSISRRRGRKLPPGNFAPSRERRRTAGRASRICRKRSPGGGPTPPGGPSEQLRSELEKSHQEMLALLDGLDDSAFDHRGYLSSGAEGSTEDNFLLVASHKRSHTNDIRSALNVTPRT